MKISIVKIIFKGFIINYLNDGVMCNFSCLCSLYRTRQYLTSVFCFIVEFLFLVKDKYLQIL